MTLSPRDFPTMAAWLAHEREEEAHALEAAADRRAALRRPITGWPSTSISYVPDSRLPHDNQWPHRVDCGRRVPPHPPAE